MKHFNYIIIVLLVTSLLLLGFNHKSNLEPYELYQVYLEGKVIGVIKNKEELENYIDLQGTKLKEEYLVDKVYAPDTLEIKKVLTYNKRTDSEESIYKKIQQLKPFTIRGVQFSLSNEFGQRDIYVNNLEVFNEAVHETMKTFVSEELYNLYLEDNQVKIETVGNIIENIYLEDDITFKEVNIPVDKTIYTRSADLAKFLLFGSNDEQQVYNVLEGDNIETIAFKNKISTEEFLISNPEFSSKSSLLFPGQSVYIGIPEPQIRVVVIEYSVRDVISDFKTDIRYDDNKVVGDDEVIRKGENGLNRVTQKIKTVNGVIVYVEPISNEELKPTIDRVVIKGKKKPPKVGDLKSWSWPTSSGYVITTPYGYRTNPFNNRREFHQALDIAIGYGADIYSANNGVVTKISYEAGGYGNYVVVNHNNGYYTLYAHLSRVLVSVDQVISSGQLIAKMGSTGASTGPHLHYELWVGEPHKGGYKINPRSVY